MLHNQWLNGITRWVGGDREREREREREKETVIVQQKSNQHVRKRSQVTEIAVINGCKRMDGILHSIILKRVQPSFNQKVQSNKGEKIQFISKQTRKLYLTRKEQH